MKRYGYMIAARLRFDWLALAFTMQMLALAVAGLLPHARRSRRGRLNFGLFDFAKAKRRFFAVRSGRAYVFKWEARALRALAGRYLPWEVHEMLNREGWAAFVQRTDREEQKRRDLAAREGKDPSGHHPTFYDSRGKRKPTELQRLQSRVRQLVLWEMQRHRRRLIALDELGV